MDAMRIIDKDGYTYDDLNPENQKVITWLKALINDIDEHKMEYEPDETDSTLERMTKETALKTIDEILDFATVTVAEYQITLIEEQ